MKPQNKNPFSSSFLPTHIALSLGLAVAGITTQSARAADGTWLNTGTTSANWSETTNWVGGTVPGATSGTTDVSVATWNTAVGTEGLAGTPVIIDSGRNIGGISFDTSSVGSYFIGTTGGNSLLLTSGGAIQLTATAITATETINAPLVLEGAGGTYSITNNSTSTGLLSLGGQISGGAAGATVLTLNGTNTGANTIGGNLVNGSATTLGITKSGAGTWVLSGTNTYTGATAINGGTLQFSGTAAMSSSALTVNTGATLALFANNGTYSPASIVFTSGGNSTIVVNSQSSNQTVILANMASNTGSNNTTINVSSTTTGETLQFNNFLPSSNSGSAWGGATNVFNLNGANVILNGITFSSDALFSVNSASGNSMTINGAVADGSSNRTLIGIVNSGGTLTLNNTVTYPGGGTNKGFAVNLAGGTLNINSAGAIDSTAVVGGTGNRATLQITSGTLDNTSTSSKTLSTNPTVAINGNFSFSTSAGTANSNLNLGTGAVTNSVSSTITLNGAGALTFGGTMTNSLAGNNTLTVNNGSTTTTFGTANFTNYILSGTASTARADVINGSGTVNITGVVSDVSSGTAASSLTYSGTGKLTLSGANTYTGATSVTGGTLVVSANSINSSSGVTINGSGAKYLYTSTTAGTNAITLTQGTLDGTGTVGAVTVGAGTGGIVANGNGGSAALTVGSLNLSGAGTINVNTVGSAGIGVTGLLTTTGAGNITINANGTGGGSWIAGTPYNLITFGSQTGSTAANSFVLGTLTGFGARYSGTLGQTSGAITLTLSGDTPKWTGLDSGNWVVGTTGANSNWKLISANTATDFITGDTVLFDDTAAGNRTINISSADVTPTSVTFTTNTNTYSVTGTNGIAGSSSLTKNGTGAVTISNANSYTGATTVNAGRLNIQNSGALGATSGTTVASGAALELQGGISVGSLPLNISGAGLAASPAGALRNVSGTNSYAGLVTLGASATIESDADSLALTNSGTITGSGFNLTLAGAGNGSVASIIGTGAGALIKSGTGTWTLTGVNTYTGGTTINGGTIQAGNNAALSATTNALAFGASSSGKLQVNGNSITVSSLNGDGTATIENSNATAGTFTDNTAGTDTFAGTIQNGTAGTLALTKSGAGTLTLSGTNTESGATTNSAGTLRYNGTAAMSGSSALTMNGGTLSLNSDATNPTFTPSGSLLIGGTSTINVGNISSGANQTTTIGATAFNSGATLNVTSSNGYVLALSAVTTNGVSPTFSPASGSTLNMGSITNNSGTYSVFNFGGAGTTNVTGAMTNSVANRSLALVFNQTGTVTLSGNSNLRNNNNASDNNNTYVNVNSGTTNFNSNNAIYSDFAAPLNLNGGAIDNTSASAVTLAGNHAISIAADFTYGGTKDLSLGNQATTLNGAVGARTITTNGSAPLTLAGAIANGTATGLTKAGAGTLKLTGANTYNGTTSVNNGTLVVNGTLGATAITVSSPATLDAGSNAVGNAALGSSVTVNSGGHLAFHLASTTGAQVTRTLTGALALGGVVDITAATAPANGSYTLVTAIGGITGTATVGTLSGVTGTLSVSGNNLVFTVGVVSGYSSWAATKGLTAGVNDGTTQDPNHNGITNLMEYVLNGDPLNGESPASILPTESISGTNFVFDFHRLHDSASDTTQVFQYGNDLTGWTDVAIPASGTVGMVAVTANLPSAGIDHIVVTVPMGANTKLFGRVHVTKP